MSTVQQLRTHFFKLNDFSKRFPVKTLTTKKPKPITYQQFMSAREIAEKQFPLFPFSPVTITPSLKIEPLLGTPEETKTDAVIPACQRLR